ncbi:fibronectin type III domain-containing protein [Sedimentitalea sp. JM2-8]|uniref:Fibronectin type III domain-containing protein n=1 Tax=Sedimentitalea xiamensis TaxID=3050037 RepID=A0ABT7FCE5_9RHOB|nr:fibronectin type III domain-containing protein [Sedimentitalea xiamensis]MDK3072781.1 fibronectin type III domain-containing protein [Sedimentitalea xiamensis]
MGKGRFQSGRFSAGRFNAGRFADAVGAVGPSYVVSITGLTSSPTHGPSAQIGVELTAVASGWSEAPPASVTYTWNNIVGVPTGTGNANYTPGAGDDLAAISVTATPADTYAPRTSASYVVRYAPPVAAGGLADQSYDTGSGDQTVNASTDFTGDDITYSVSTTIPGVTINSGTGVVTIPTGSDASGTITVTGTNSGGADSTAFSVVIDAAATAPVLSGLDASGAPDALELDVDIASNLYWSLDPVGTNPDGDTIVAGGITDSGGPDAISAGANVIAFDFSAIAAGTYDLSFVASNGGVLSNVLRQEITLSAAATVPATMSAPTVTQTGSTSISVDLAAAPDDGGSSITSYDLRWQPDGGPWTEVTGISDPEAISGLTASTLYNVQTRAVNAVGQGAWSASGSDTTAAGGVTYSDDFTSDTSASYTSGNGTMTYNSSDDTLEYTLGDGWTGITTPEITTVDAQSYTITIEAQMLFGDGGAGNPGSSVMGEFIVGTTAGAGNILGSSTDRFYGDGDGFGPVMTLTQTVAASGTAMHITIRSRAGTAGKKFAVHSILVEPA